MGPYVEGMWDITPAPQALAKAELAKREEEWLKNQVTLLQESAKGRLFVFATILGAALHYKGATEGRKFALKELHALMRLERGTEGHGGLGGHLPNQVKKHPKLRVAIWNLFAREFGTNSFGSIFRPKSGDEVRPNVGSNNSRPPPKPLRRYRRA